MYYIENIVIFASGSKIMLIIRVRKNGEKGILWPVRKERENLFKGHSEKDI
ncbi:hypothetical protein M104_1141 [Bacteroides fragilis str. 1007-1-F |uniref:Uncharacterized protein n=2 Tax=Bacteroides fragilis TaxID=817 RepID=A0AAN4SJH4_BACFG|nr:hypothetical protein M101_5193 [Bacteroides fragilis str. 1007-1-F \